MPDKIRLFTALKVPGSLEQQIAALPRKGLDSASWAHAEDLHITLRFLGEVDEEKIPAIEERLAGVRVKKFGVNVMGLGIFRKPQHSVLYANVESTRKITHLVSEITERLQKAGFVFTAQHYTPHVTLARVKNPHGLEEYARRNQNKIHAEWMAESFCLFHSANYEEGEKRYTLIRTYNFQTERRY